ncbi:MAG: hypothetical protein ABGZ53_04525 [Fuerstiella sp.]
MRRVLTTAVALIIAFSVTAGSEAGKRRASKQRSTRTAVQSSSNAGFFANMMELERRKNAWLRARFTRG